MLSIYLIFLYNSKSEIEIQLKRLKSNVSLVFLVKYPFRVVTTPLIEQKKLLLRRRERIHTSPKGFTGYNGNYGNYGNYVPATPARKKAVCQKGWEARNQRKAVFSKTAKNNNSQSARL
jgi:hypothetical protein